MLQELDKLFPNLTEENIKLFAAKLYETPTNIMDEFLEDFARVKFLKRAFRKARKSGKINPQIILNHLVVLRNTMGPNVVRILFFKVDQEDWSSLKTYLSFLSLLPRKIHGINRHKY